MREGGGGLTVRLEGYLPWCWGWVLIEVGSLKRGKRERDNDAEWSVRGRAKHDTWEGAGTFLVAYAVKWAYVSSGISSALGLPLNYRIYYTFSLAAGGRIKETNIK